MAIKEKNWKRNCPSCGDKLLYTRKYSKIRAEKQNTNCKSCSVIGRNKGKKLSIEHKENIRESNKGQVPWNKGLTKETHEVMKRISESQKGKKLTDEHKKHIGKSNKGKKRSEETRKRMRLHRIKEIENKCGQIHPNYNKSAIPIIRAKAKELEIIDLLDAETFSGEFYIKELGYWVDGYSKEKNIVIEVDEKHHFDKDGNLKQKDIHRQKEIEKYLKCKFIRIKL